MKILVLDFETKDPYIAMKMGAGWAYDLKKKTEDRVFFPLGYSYCWISNNVLDPSFYIPGNNVAAPPFFTIQQTVELNELIKQAEYVVMHNAQYDLGCLLSLGINIDNIKVLDTKIIGVLIDNRMVSYSLDYLASYYLGHKKAKGALAQVVLDNKLAKINPKTKTAITKAEQWAYQNMDKIQEVAPEVMAHYANIDTQLTAKLLLNFLHKVPIETAHYWSNFQLICTKIRARGVKIDMEIIREGLQYLDKELELLKKEIIGLAGLEFDINSPAQTAKVLIKKGFKLPKTSKNQDSSHKEWLKEQDDPLCKKLLEYRTAALIKSSFFEKPLEWQKYACPEALAGERYGWLYPELNVLGAAATGRFSSSNPNIQQIPKRSDKWGKLCRSIFITNNKENNWISIDWASQETRLQIHSAIKINADGADKMALKLKENRNVDFHQIVADLTGLKRSDAKTINLGLSYGMGQAKLCRTLGLEIVEKTTKTGRKYLAAGPEGEKLLKAYHRNMPYLKALDSACKETLINRGFIYTLSRRKLLRQFLKDGRSLDYKALNMHIQGSAADQCLNALKLAYEKGLDIICLVHDEFNIEGSLEDAKVMQNIMEDGMELNVPMVAEVSMGPSWGQLEKVNE